MEWQTTPKQATDGAHVRRGNADDTGVAARAQAAELTDEELKAGYIRGVASVRKVGDPAQHEAKVRSAIQASMRRAGVPLANVTFKPLRSGRRGEFDRSTWTLVINRRLFHDGGQRVELLGSLYHEARHAEQYFDAMRAFAARHPRVAPVAFMRHQRQQRQRVPPLHIVQAAFRLPTHASAAVKWYTHHFGAGMADRIRVADQYQFARMKLASIERELAGLRAKLGGALDADDPRVRALARRHARAKSEHIAAYDAYRAQPDEAEAHDLGDSIRGALRGPK